MDNYGYQNRQMYMPGERSQPSQTPTSPTPQGGGLGIHPLAKQLLEEPEQQQSSGGLLSKLLDPLGILGMLKGGGGGGLLGGLGNGVAGGDSGFGKLLGFSPLLSLLGFGKDKPQASPATPSTNDQKPPAASSTDTQKSNPTANFMKGFMGGMQGIPPQIDWNAMNNQIQNSGGWGQLFTGQIPNANRTWSAWDVANMTPGALLSSNLNAADQNDAYLGNVAQNEQSFPNPYMFNMGRWF